jgi:hypothetical protein
MKRILVVEDQGDLCAILRDFLTATGYTGIAPYSPVQLLGIIRGYLGEKA